MKQRVFRSRAEAEAAALYVNDDEPTWAYQNDEDGTPFRVATVRTDLEAKLAEVIEDFEWSAGTRGHRACPLCRGLLRGSGHHADCKLSLVLKAFRGETT